MGLVLHRGEGLVSSFLPKKLELEHKFLYRMILSY
jgi:hypothetical protein